MNCTLNKCGQPAVLVYATKIDSRRGFDMIVKYVGRCMEHRDAPTANKWLRKGEPCGCCTGGFIERWQFVDYGKCYRCFGTGFWAGKFKTPC